MPQPLRPLLFSLALTPTLATAQIQFAQRIDSLSSGSSAYGALADADGDGDLDVFCSTIESRLEIRLNNGEGVFDDGVIHVPIPSLPGVPDPLQLADFDGDGDPDVILWRTSLSSISTILVLRNDGGGTFVAETTQQIPLPLIGLTPADLDRDGDLDLVVTSLQVQSSTEAWINDGANVFSPSSLLPARPGGSAKPAAVGDLNGDGQDDIVSVRADVTLYLSTPSAYVDASVSLPSTDVNLSVIQDFNGDSNLDVLCVRNTRRSHLYLGDGAGSFVRGADTVFTAPIDNVYPADVDRDGLLDLITLSQGPNPTVGLLINDGSGSFRNETAGRMISLQGPGMFCATGDIDNDGDTDIYVGNRFWRGRHRVQINRHKQLEVRDPLTLGTTVRVRFFRKPGYGTSPALGLAMAGDAALSPLPTAFGPLWLAPSTAVTLPFVSIPSPTGVAETTLMVPQNQALVGLDVAFQGVIVDDEPLRLSNPVLATVR